MLTSSDKYESNSIYVESLNIVILASYVCSIANTTYPLLAKDSMFAVFWVLFPPSPCEKIITGNSCCIGFDL